MIETTTMKMTPSETTTKTRAMTTARREEEILTKMMMMKHESGEDETTSSRIPVNVNPLLRIGVTCEDIFPIVVESTATTSDATTTTTQSHQQQETAYKLHEELTQSFTSKQKESKYVLMIQISKVTDGSSSTSKKQRKSLMNRLLGSSTTTSKRKVNPSSSSSHNNNDNIDVAKLAINYCLYLRSTNEVAFVDRKTYTKKKTPAASSKRMSKRISNSFNSNTNSDVLDDLMKTCANDLRRQIMAVSTQHPVPRRISSSTFRINPSPVANQPQRKESMIVVDKKYTTTTSMIPKPPQRLPSVDYYESDHHHHHQIFRRISRETGMYCVDEAEAIEKQQKQNEIQQKRLSDLEERWSGELLKQQRQGYRLPTI